ncbi:MAG: Uma2 family endonuclease [Deltaproteobacteria bacterium]|nr:Uma2 family endonuclease [Deltaproteobacteria bacterium]
MTSATAPAPRLFSRDEFQHLAMSGLFAGEKVELIDGVVIAMSPQNTPHAATVNRLNYQLMRLCGSEVYLRVQSPVALGDYNQPEPDLALCAPDPLDYAEAHPRPEQIFLLIEVADASLRQDRQRKARLYARSGIPQYWVVDLARRRVEVMTSPHRAAERYVRVRIFRAGQTVALPQGPRIAVSDILPPRRT